MRCACQGPNLIAWRLTYGPLIYHVCDDCLHHRLDAADGYAPYEPDQIESVQELW